MKKIGIITLTKNSNYGNVLQNIALQETLQKMGYFSETIINLTGSTLFGKIPNDYKNVIKFAINYGNFRNNMKRDNIFRKFCCGSLKYSKIFYNNGKFNEFRDEYDYYVTGSDQVWNPTFGMASEFEFLTFAPYNKRISYAASFGVDNLDMLSNQQKQVIGNMLSGLKSISVREESGKKIVESLCQTKADVHIDPTMLLSRNEWGKKSRKPSFKIPDTYILIYMLGNITAEYDQIFKEISNKIGAKIINLFQGRYQYVDPAEFIWLIKNAECICTDSFHASVFSILFHKNFFIFDRKDNHADQNTRFYTLLSKCKIPMNKVIYKKNSNINTIDWEEVDKNLLI